MIYPKDIVEFVKNDSDLSSKFSHVAAIDSIHCGGPESKTNDLDFEEYMLKYGYLQSRAIRRYLHYLSTALDTFYDIYRYFPKENPSSTSKYDTGTIGTDPTELFYHAMYLYYLDSWGVEGDVIECGTFKGYSACCLSWVCSYLGRKLIVADSFEGLPDTITDPIYSKGDFCGSFDEVKANIEDFGRIESVEFRKGFFDASLKDFDRKLCMIWMDVDLYESTMDIVDNIYKCLTENGIMISHELFEERDFGEGKLKDIIGPSKALYEFFTRENIQYWALPLENGSGLIVPSSDDRNLLFSRKHVQYLRDSCSQCNDKLYIQALDHEKDVLHWRGEVDKLMKIYTSTIEFKIKAAIKKVLRK